ncbi:MAG: aldo/keto reductase [Clostridia bacterium]|nr:aldo/keto reductase [Clostridia bacterium]
MDYFGKDVPKLGFGLMRLPRKGFKIDIPQVSKMVDMFLEAGFTHFDTAPIYPGSEAAIRQALVERYPRESYTLSTKLNATIMAGVTSEKGIEKEFQASLKKTGAGYFDYYFLHMLMENNYKNYDKYHCWDFVKKKKEEGLIRHYGFSFHGGPELLDELLTMHPDVEFVLLQLNYLDWENNMVASRANYEVARKHNKPIVVMEPIKGGILANPPDNVKELFKKYNPNLSYASWAVRYAASLEGIITVLSGMSDIAAMEDNLSYMKDFQPLNEEEQKIIQEAQRLMGKSSTIPCTGCRYCAKGCPKEIDIPLIFEALNKQLGNGQLKEAKELYNSVATEGKRASDCIGCLQCERSCPQKLNITDYLRLSKETLE